jgi:hypothetical protein
MTVSHLPPFDDVPPAQRERATVLLTCRPGVGARRKAQAAEGDDVESQVEESYKVVVQEEVVAAVARRS